MKLSDWIQIGIMLGTLIGVFLAVISLRKAQNTFRKQMQLSFFAEYTKRYQEIMLQLPIKVFEKHTSLSQFSEAEHENTLRYMRAYFDLCSEQYELYRSKNIEEKIWLDWQSGMQNYFSKKAFQESWEVINLEQYYFPEFTRLINNFLKAAPSPVLGG